MLKHRYESASYAGGFRVFVRDDLVQSIIRHISKESKTRLGFSNDTTLFDMALFMSSQCLIDVETVGHA